jgi:hypothetical protein
MVKKILFISFLFFSIAGFSQKTLQNLSAAPNPFYSQTTIRFKTTKKQPIFLFIKNLLGKTVYKKVHTAKIGKNSIVFKKNNLQAGMYIYAIQSRKEIISKRIIIK